MEYYLALKKNEILPFVTAWMDLEDIMLSEISNTEKDKCHTISLICGIYRTKQTNKTDAENRLKVVRGNKIWGAG